MTTKFIQKLCLIKLKNFHHDIHCLKINLKRHTSRADNMKKRFYPNDSDNSEHLLPCKYRLNSKCLMGEGFMGGGTPPFTISESVL